MNDLLVREFKESDKANTMELFFEFGKYLEKLDKEYLGLIVMPEDYGEKLYLHLIKVLMSSIKSTNIQRGTLI